MAPPGRIALVHVAADAVLAASIGAYLADGKGLPVAVVAAPAPGADAGATGAGLKPAIAADAVLVLWTRASSDAAWFAAYLAEAGTPSAAIGLRVGAVRIPPPFDRWQTLNLPADPAVLALSLTVLGAMLGTKPPEPPPEAAPAVPDAPRQPVESRAALGAMDALAAAFLAPATAPRAPRRRWRFWSRGG